MAKKSRRARRQEAEKQRKSAFDVAAAASAKESSPTVVAAPKAAAPVSEPVVEDKPSVSRKIVDFAREYFYVYVDLKNILIVAALMVVVLIGLSFVI